MSSKEIRMKPGKELLERLGIQFIQLEEIRYSERRNILRVLHSSDVSCDFRVGTIVPGFTNYLWTGY